MSLFLGGLACGKSEGDASDSLAGAGGTSLADGGTTAGGMDEGGGGAKPSEGGGGGGGATVACDDEWPAECCDAPDRLPCRDFSEAECTAAPYCSAIRGTPWRAGDSVIPAGARGYVGCQSKCADYGGEDAFFCVFKNSNPAACFLVSGQGRNPDGWSELSECEGLPDGSCVE